LNRSLARCVLSLLNPEVALKEDGRDGQEGKTDCKDATDLKCGIQYADESFAGAAEMIEEKNANRDGRGDAQPK